MSSQVLYDDGRAVLDEEGRRYYFPLGTSKRIRYGQIQGVRARPMAGLSGKSRGWGSSHPGYWLLVLLNEAALMIDAQLGDPNAVVDGSSAQLLHQRLFDIELALTNIARFAQAMAGLDLPADYLLCIDSWVGTIGVSGSAGAATSIELVFVTW